MDRKNPKEFAHVGRPGKILALFDEFSPVTETDPGWTIGQDGLAVQKQGNGIKDNTSPAGLHGKFSRIKMTFITSDNQPYVNISPDLIDSIYMKTQGAVTAHIMGLASSSGVPDSPAYTARFKAGRLSGKTCAEVIAEQGAVGAQALSEQYTYLSQNVQRYPGNRALMDAITDAINLYNAGQLITTAKGPSFTPVTIMDIPIQTSIGNTNANGKSLIRTASVVADYNNDCPYTVKITNAYAVVEKKEDGRQIAKWTTAENRAEQSLNLTENEWIAFAGKMKSQKDAYEASVYAYEKKIANKYDEINRKAGQRQAQQYQNPQYQTPQYQDYSNMPQGYSNEPVGFEPAGFASGY